MCAARWARRWSEAGKESPSLLSEMNGNWKHVHLPGRPKQLPAGPFERQHAVDTPDWSAWLLSNGMLMQMVAMGAYAGVTTVTSQGALT